MNVPGDVLDALGGGRLAVLQLHRAINLMWTACRAPRSVATWSSEAAIAALIELGHPIMVDSGAFSEVVFTANGPRTVAPIDDSEWKRRLDVYLRLSRSLGRRVMVVAPDSVGAQNVTLLRLTRYRELMRDINLSGAVILLPLQVGAMTHLQFLRSAEAAAAVPLVPAMPMRKAATSTSALLAFVEETKPPHIHLLGMGIENRRAERLIEAIRYFSAAGMQILSPCKLRARSRVNAHSCPVA